MALFCSWRILAQLGLLATVAPAVSMAQTAGTPLRAGTLPVLSGRVSGTVDINATAPGASRPLLTIEQKTPRAVISWKSFDIASDSEVRFIQPSSAASALNRIYSANPSVIQGKLSANGQVVLINQNGVLFERGAQVNVGSLIASSLNITNERFLSGVVASASDAAFQGGYDEAGNPLPARPDGSRPGSIRIGASGPTSAAAPLIESGSGGSIMIFAPDIDNANGIIKSPDGQVILAAGKKVFLSANPNASDITLRGLVVEVAAEEGGDGLNLSNLIRNAGQISADRGNVTLAALAINQQGRITADTAVQTNGSIYLKARAQTESAGVKAGSVTLAPGSVTAVDPSALDKSTLVESQDYTPFRGVVEVRGGTIDNSGTVRATGGKVLLAAENAADPDAARIYLDNASLTSTAGAWTDVDFNKNLATFRVTSNELKNSPDQKDGILRGATVTVDLRRDNSILALDGYRGTVPRTVAEKAATGGEVTIQTSGSVIQREGATIDVSGGGYRYNGGLSNTSQFLGGDGKLYDIATAPQALPLAAQLDNVNVDFDRWGQTITYANPLGRVGTYQPGYSEGKAGGTVTIASRTGLVLDGALRGGVTVGAQQLARAPTGASLRIGGGIVASTGNYNVGQLIGNLVWRQQAADSLGEVFQAGDALAQGQRDSFALAAEQVFGAARRTADGLVEQGFGTVEVNSNGSAVVPAGVSINAGVGANLLMRAPSIDVGGDVRLPAGNLTLTTIANPGAFVSPDVVALSERITVRSGAELSTAGAWLNNAARNGAFVGEPLPSGRARADGSIKRSIDGGALAVNIDDQALAARLDAGAVLDVGGGASINSGQRVTAGNGGRLSIVNGSGGQTSSDWLRAELRGFAPNTGAELSLSMNRVLIQTDQDQAVLPGTTTRLAPALFKESGFSKLTINANAEIDIGAGAAVLVQQRSLVIDPVLAAAVPTGSALGAAGTVQQLPDHLRPAASLSLSGAALTVPEGASIATDARGQIALTGSTGLRIDGHLEAPGGTINLTVRGPDTLLASDLWLSQTARVSAAGTFVATPDSRGLTVGSLFNGGNVTLTGAQAGVRIDRGAIIDVGAFNQVVDSPDLGAASLTRQQTLVGHAGTLTVKSQGATLLAGQMLGHGGDASAAGGSFALESRRPDQQIVLPSERRIVVTPAGEGVVPVAGLADAQVNVNALDAGGFEKVRLLAEGRIEFQGSSTLAFERGLRLDAPLIDVAGSSTVSLIGSSVALGQSLAPRVFEANVLGNLVWQSILPIPSPTLPTRRGEGQLSITADSVDLFGSVTINGSSLTRINSKSDARFIGRETTSPISGQPPVQTGWLHTAGDLDITAAQLYPTTRTSFSVAVADQPGAVSPVDSYLKVSANGNTPGDVYSAGGSLSLQAGSIFQGGTVKAPLGSIELKADRLLDLAPGSVTSVSGDGLTVLYGSTQAGVAWNYVDASGNSRSEVTSVSSGGKRISLAGSDIKVREGAKVDLSGGGEVMAVEFVPGNGGDRDVTLQDNTYAIIPKSALATMPYDAHVLLSIDSKDPGFGFSVTQGRDSVLYDAIDIGTGGAVPSGKYVLLPARFAHLPDAYLVQLQTGSAFRDLQDGQTTALSNGNVVVAGHRSAVGTSVRESQTVGVVTLPGSAVRRSSDYTLSGALLLAQNAERERLVAPAAPWDAGSLSLANATLLSLQGEFSSAPAVSPSSTPARAAQVDIEGKRLAVVDAVGRPDLPADFLQISGDSLSKLNASVVLGGRRVTNGGTTRINTAADEVRIANSAAGEVVVPELIVVAKELIDVAPGSALRATGSAPATGPDVIQTDAGGAMLRLSGNKQIRLDRGAASSASGDISIAAGASLVADRAILIDATRSTRSRGTLTVGGSGGVGGSLSLSAGQVSLGSTQGLTSGAEGLVLSNTELAAYASLDALTLRGYESIDLLGATTVGSEKLAKLTLDTPLLRGTDALASVATGPQATITARELTVSNTSARTAPAGSGSGALVLQAERLTLGTGNKSISGFAAVGINASERVNLEDAGSLRVAGVATVQTPLVYAAGGSRQGIAAVIDSDPAAPIYLPLAVRLPSVPSTRPATAAANIPLTFGGQVELTGTSVAISTTLQAPSGQISVQAVGGAPSDGIVLGGGAVLDVAGRTKNFHGSYVAADGGSVTLNAAAASVAVQAGARVDVSGPQEGGAAGRLSVRAKTLSLQGELAGNAAAGYRSGSIDLDLAALANFSSLNVEINRGEFGEERRLRARGGNVLVAADDAVLARRVWITADAGAIDVAGTIGSGAPHGAAAVELDAATGLSFAGGSRIVANASDVGARGGEVRVATRGGALSFDATAEIDVRAGDGGPAGSVVFGVARDASGNLGAASLQGMVRRTNATGDSVATVDLEATRTYEGTDVGTSLTLPHITAWAADHAAFVASVTTRATELAGGLRDEAGVSVGARVLGATELKASGDLSLDAIWDLTTASWLAAGNPGTLTIRAAGDLTLRDTLGAPRLATNSSNAATNDVNQNVNHALRQGDTWGVRLAAGADLASADALATVPLASLSAGKGDVLLTGANSNIRTGTGRIDIAAAGDVRLDNVASSIYTAGRIGATDTAINGNNRWGVNGGGISIRAGANVAGPTNARDIWITEWLRRDRLAPNTFTTSGNPTDWWAYRPRFQQAVGTLAGGDIDIRAAGSVTEFSAMLPTVGRTSVDANRQRQVDVTGGGDLSLFAGRDIVGGTFLIGRGRGHLEAAGNIGAGEAIQLYMMGVSSGKVPESANIDLVAGGSLTLASVSNPTMLAMINSNGATGPSFDPRIATTVNSLTPTRFFTYSADSALGLQAKSGDVRLEGVIAEATTYASKWRGHLPTAPALSTTALGANTAFPASLSIVAVGGDVVGPQAQARIKTYPSASATVSVLAGGSISDLSLEVSDLGPLALTTPFNRPDEARPTGGNANVSSGSLVSALELRNGSADRIVERRADLPYGLVKRDATLQAYRFDWQALDGSIATVTDGASSSLYLPALSRVRAGVDIADYEFSLQNLNAADVSVIQADTGDLRYDAKSGISRRLVVGGPGRLLLQAGRNIDLGTVPVQAVGNDLNPGLGDESARLTLIAGVTDVVDLQAMGGSVPNQSGGASGAYGQIVTLNSASDKILDLYGQLATETDETSVLAASSVASLAVKNTAYSRFVSLDTDAPQALAAFQSLVRNRQFPLLASDDGRAAAGLYSLLNAETDLRRLQTAGSVANLAAGPGGVAYRNYVELDNRYPRLFDDYVLRRTEGARPTDLTPVVFSEALSQVVAKVVPSSNATGGNILSYQTSIQTFGGSDIDLWAPSTTGSVVAGLTSPSSGDTIGILTTAGGAIRSVVGGDFNVNQGKVITARGGDILMLSLGGSIDAGRGAKTSVTTAPPQVVREPDGRTTIVFSSAATGSGIQSLTSDPDGLGPLVSPRPGDVYLFAPAGSIDAGEAGIRSSGNIVINARTVLNASDIRAGGSSQGVPVAVAGSLASSVATSGGNTASGSKAAEEASNAATNAAKAAASAVVAKPSILTVEILGFGEKNCKEQDKDCFAK